MRSSLYNRKPNRFSCFELYVLIEIKQTRLHLKPILDFLKQSYNLAYNAVNKFSTKNSKKQSWSWFIILSWYQQNLQKQTSSKFWNSEPVQVLRRELLPNHFCSKYYSSFLEMFSILWSVALKIMGNIRSNLVFFYYFLHLKYLNR